MARTMTHSLFDGEIEGTPFVGIMRELVGADGARERAKGGLWVKLEGDTDAVLAALTDAASAALEFAARAEALHAEILARKPKAQPKAATKAPTPPKAQAAPARKAQPAPAPAKKPADPVAVAANRAIAVAAARANKPAPTPRVSAPVPAKSDSFTAADWSNLIG